MPRHYGNTGITGGGVPNVLEIPSIYTVPTKAEVFADAVGERSYDCDCNPRGQGPGRRSGPQNPYQMPAPQGLGQPDRPQKPFQPVSQDPCAPVAEALRGLGIDPDCLKQMMGRKSPSATRRRAKSATKSRRKKATAKSTMPRSGKKRKKGAKTRRVSGSPGAKGYRKLKNGTCYDVSAKRFVAKRYCS